MPASEAYTLVEEPVDEVTDVVSEKVRLPSSVRNSLAPWMDNLNGKQNGGFAAGVVRWFFLRD